MNITYVKPSNKTKMLIIKLTKDKGWKTMLKRLANK